jgi:hypothetical protein
VVTEEEAAEFRFNLEDLHPVDDRHRFVFVQAELLCVRKNLGELPQRDRRIELWRFENAVVRIDARDGPDRVAIKKLFLEGLFLLSELGRGCQKRRPCPNRPLGT